MREEKPDVQGRCHRAKWKIISKNLENFRPEKVFYRKMSTYTNPGPSIRQASTLPLRHHRSQAKWLTITFVLFQLNSILQGTENFSQTSEIFLTPKYFKKNVCKAPIELLRQFDKFASSTRGNAQLIFSVSNNGILDGSSNCLGRTSEEKLVGPVLAEEALGLVERVVVVHQELVPVRVAVVDVR